MKEGLWWDSTLERHAQKPCDDAQGLPAPQQVKICLDKSTRCATDMVSHCHT